MRRCLYGMIMLMLVLCMGGCQKNQTYFNDSEESKTKETPDTGDAQAASKGAFQTADGEVHDELLEYLKRAKASKNKLVWIVSTPISGAWYDGELLAKFNEKLRKEKNLELELCYLPDDEDKYGQRLRELLEKGYGDLCFSGEAQQWKTSFQDQKALVENGLVHDLGDMAGSKEERMIRDAFDEEEWNGVKESEGTFFLPTQVFFAHRAYVAFSKKYIPQEKAGQFDGKLDSLLGYVDKKAEKELGRNTIVWNMSYYDTLSSLGICQLEGVWYSHETGEAAPAFSSDKWYSVFRMLHDCWERDIMFRRIQWDSVSTELANKQIAKNEFAIAVFANDSLLDSVGDTATVYEMPYYFSETGAGHTAVAEQSEKKQQVYSLLSTLLGDSSYANLFILGEKGKDYTIKDGYAYDAEDEIPIGAHVAKSTFGISDMVHNAIGEEFGKDVKKGKKAYFSSKNCRISALNGFRPDLGSVSNISDEKYLGIWKKKDFEKQYKAVREKFAQKQKKDIEILNRQVREWKKTR